MHGYESILQAVRSWGAGLDGFTDEHARDGVALGRGYVDGIAAGQVGGPLPGLDGADDRTRALVAIDIAWILWLDDRFDHAIAEGRTVDEAAIEAALDEAAGAEEGGRPGDGACASGATCGGARASAEQEGTMRLCRAVARMADPGAYRAWLAATRDVVASFAANDRLARGLERWSYSEYLAHGESSVTILQVVATVAAALDMDLAGRLVDPRFARLLSHFARLMRLQNDLASAERERRDGVAANAVFLVERYASAAAARAFVAEERVGLERLVERELARLGPRDGYARLLRAMIRWTDCFYATPRARYEVTAPPPAPRAEAMALAAAG